MFEHVGNLVARHWLAVILGWAALAAALHRAAPRWDDVTHDGEMGYLPAQMTSVRAERLLAEAFPENRARSQVAVFCVRLDAPLSADDKAALERVAAQFAPDLPHGLPIAHLWTPTSEVVGGKLLHRHAAVAVLSLSTEFMSFGNIAVLEAVNAALARARRAADFPAGLQWGATGSAAVGGDTMAAARDSIRNTEAATILLVLGVLALVYRAPLLVFIPLLTIAASVLVASDVVSLLTQARHLPGCHWLDFKIFKTTKIFIVTLLYGAGTDFCLFLIARYKEELAHRLDGADALAAALGHVGKPIAASALTTVVGLAMLFFADFGKFRNSGPAIGLCLLIALAACLTLAPALLRAFGPWVFWPGAARPPEHAPPASRPQRPALSARLWSRIGRGILAWPGLLLVVSVALLAPLAFRGLDVPVTFDFMSELDADRPSVQGARLMRQVFPAGEASPITILVRQPHGQFHSKPGEQKIARLTRALYGRSLDGDPPDTLECRHLRAIEGVASVRSLTEPLGDRPGLTNLFGGAGQRKAAARGNPKTRALYVSSQPDLAGQVARFDVVLRADPFSRQAAATLAAIDQALARLAADPRSDWQGAEFDFLGVTSGIRDLKAVTDSDQRRIQWLVVMAVLGVLIAILRRPVVCLYLVLSVLFGYYVTIGATDLVFARLYPAFDGLDWKVPIFLFVLLIAVGADYNIYLATRVFEEQRRHGPRAGLQIAIEKTGGIITSCGVIMAGTFASMLTGSLRGMMELGFALSLGVLLDTMVIRSILVPAFLALACRFEDDAGHRGAQHAARLPARSVGRAE